MRDEWRTDVDIPMGRPMLAVAARMCKMVHFALPGPFRPLETDGNVAPTSDSPDETNGGPAEIPAAPDLPGRWDAGR